MSHRRLIPLSLLTFVAATQIGCFRAATQLVYEVQGAKADIIAHQSVPNAQFADYNSVTFLPASTSMGAGLRPGSITAQYNTALDKQREALAETFPGGSRELTVSSDIKYVQGKGLLGTAMMLTRVYIRDGGVTKADVLVRAERKSLRAGDRSALAEASAKALAGYLMGKEQPKQQDD